MRNVIYFIAGIGIAIGINFAVAQVAEVKPLESVAKIEFQALTPRTKNITNYSINELILIELKSINASVRQIEKQTK
jgi:hypothetical protein